MALGRARAGSIGREVCRRPILVAIQGFKGGIKGRIGATVGARARAGSLGMERQGQGRALAAIVAGPELLRDHLLELVGRDPITQHELGLRVLVNQRRRQRIDLGKDPRALYHQGAAQQLRKVVGCVL